MIEGEEVSMRKTINGFLTAAVIVPVVLLFWPYAWWNDAMSLILRVIPSFAAQALFCRNGAWPIIKGIPTMLTGTFAARGTYLYFTSSHWSNATFWGSLMADYVSPFICCIIVMIVYLFIHKRKDIR